MNTWKSGSCSFIAPAPAGCSHRCSRQRAAAAAAAAAVLSLSEKYICLKIKSYRYLQLCHFEPSPTCPPALGNFKPNPRFNRDKIKFKLKSSQVDALLSYCNCAPKPANAALLYIYIHYSTEQYIYSLQPNTQCCCQYFG